LLAKVEEYAAQKEALYVRTNTATFQALDFYLKNGYELFAKLPILVDGVKGQEDCYLIKYLNTEEGIVL